MKNGIVMGSGDGLWGRWEDSYQIVTYTIQKIEDLKLTGEIESKIKRRKSIE
jgi:hypothetical protein